MRNKTNTNDFLKREQQLVNFYTQGKYLEAIGIADQLAAEFAERDSIVT